MLNNFGSKARARRLLVAGLFAVLAAWGAQAFGADEGAPTVHSEIQEALGDEAESVPMIFVTIDPEQDTPERLQAYAQRYRSVPQWRFLTGDAERIVAVQKAFDIDRASKLNHEPITLLRGPGESQWLRIDGVASASDIVDEYRALLMAKH